jgi:hypothetical protein
MEEWESEVLCSDSTALLATASSIFLEDEMTSWALIIMVFAVHVLYLHLGHENDHSPLSSAKVQKAWNYCSALHIFSGTLCLSFCLGDSLDMLSVDLNSLLFTCSNKVDSEVCTHLEYYTASNVNPLPTFWGKILVPSSRVKSPRREDWQCAQIAFTFTKSTHLPVNNILYEENMCKINYSSHYYFT